VEILFFLLIFIGITTLVGHGIWLALAWFFRFILGDQDSGFHADERCPACSARLKAEDRNCPTCNRRRGGETFSEESLRELASTTRVLAKLHNAGKIPESTLNELLAAISEERERLEGRSLRQPDTRSQEPPAPTVVQPISIHEDSVTSQRTSDSPSPPRITDRLSDPETVETSNARPAYKPQFQRVDEQRNDATRSAPAPVQQPVKPARPFSEVLLAFMEQSNIRWGEIIGGLLIIGCSTALVVSLWNEISQIPVLKFLIFTTVTAALFAVGLYTEHHWKLPTTSRGILTIATLLVPLNFLAIAAVTGGKLPSGPVVIASEIVAPLLFFWCVLFAGRVITPAWPRLLVAGVLATSVGQLLVRHFVTPDSSPAQLLVIGFLPLASCAASIAWMIYRADQDGKVTDAEASAIFVTLGASVFATVLPIGLLLFKAGNIGQAAMQISPLVAIGALPLLATGLFLWKRLTDTDLAVSRTVGTAIAIIGAAVSVGSIFMAWPNPASVVLTALIAFATFTLAAEIFSLPPAHLIAALCLCLAYLTGFHAAMGHIAWQVPSETSLLTVLLYPSSGQSLALLFLMLIAASEWLRTRRFGNESGIYYLLVAGLVAAFSSALISTYGFGLAGDPYEVSLVFAVYCSGAGWVAWRLRQAGISWIASGFLFVALAQFLGALIGFRFPWQAAALFHATVCALAANYLYRKPELGGEKILATLRTSALLTSAAAVVMMIQAAAWEPSSMLSSRIFWLAGIWLLLLWVNRSEWLFNAFQAALAFGVVIAVKASLLNFQWYAFSRNSTLNPFSLQIHGITLAILGLFWVGVRHLSKVSEAADLSEGLTNSLRKVFGHDSPFGSFLTANRPTFDRVLNFCLVGGFTLFCFYAVLPGVRAELAPKGNIPSSIDIGGFPHANAFGLGSWILLALLVLLMLCSLWQSRKGSYLLGALAVLQCSVLLLSGYFESSNSVGSAWRWLAVLFLAGISIVFLYREQLKKVLGPQLTAGTDDDSKTFTQSFIAELLFLTIGPLITLTAFATISSIAYLPPTGPSTGIFSAMGEVASYTVPLILMALVFAGYAWKAGSPRFAFASALSFNLSVTVAHVLSVMTAGGSMNRVVLASALQYNSITAAICAIVWIASRKHWIKADQEPETALRLLRLLVGFAIVSNVVLIGPVAVRLVTHPEWAGIGTAATGDLHGWNSLILCAVAGLGLAKEFKLRISALPLFAFVLAVGTLVAFGLAPLGTTSWLGFHALLVACALTGWAMLIALAAVSGIDDTMSGAGFQAARLRLKDQLSPSFEVSAVRMACLAGLITVFLGIRASGDDPTGYWWVIGAFASTAVLMAALSFVTYSTWFLYAAGLLFNVAASVWWISVHYRDTSIGVRITGFLYFNVVALALPSVLWTYLGLRSRKARAGRADNRFQPFSFHHVSALLSVALLCLPVFIGILLGLAGDPIRPYTLLSWVALLAAAAAMTANLYDEKARYAVAGIYVVGLLGLGMVLDHLGLSPRNLFWTGVIFVAGYTIVTSFVWRRRLTLLEFAERLKMPVRQEEQLRFAWLGVSNAVLSTLVFLTSYWMILSYGNFTLRTLAAIAVTAQVLSFGLADFEAWRPLWRRIGLAFFSVGIILCFWSYLEPGSSGTWLNRAVLMMIASLVLIAADGLGSKRIFHGSEGWILAARQIVPWVGVAGGLALLFVLGTELHYQNQFGIVNINWVSLLTVAVTLLSAAVVFVVFAVSPKRDPLKLDERGRMRYVYVAEVMLALLFMHIRLTMPWLFSGFFGQYWPLVVIAIAFAGVGISEVFRRQGISVLAAPLVRTGALLPLLPVLGYWFANSRVEYSVVLFLIGLLYMGLSILRRSFAFGLLAALAGNGALWDLFYHTHSFGFFQHPQLWLVPFALSVLVAAQINRDRLNDGQLTTIRYVSLIVIYVSSTADIFISGVAQSPWLPLVLAGLSIAGVFCGISLRVRAFLYLGAVFLLIAVITMISYASVNLGWTWLWYVAGIFTGGLIIFIFAMFEKKRAEMLRLVDGLREWQN